MILALLLTAVRCADPGLCPTRAELEQAIENDRQGLEAYFKLLKQKAILSISTSTTVHRHRRLTGLYCGKPFDPPKPAIECRFTLHYPDRRERRTATLAKVAGTWQIGEPDSASGD
jgi:hypothetical protein